MRTGIALGSNLGDRLANLRAARAAIAGVADVRPPLRSAPVVESEAVDCEPGTPAFLNSVIEVTFDGHPMTLLDELRAIEVKLGRPSKHPRNVSRLIDLDVLYVGNLALRNEEIVIPHPRLHRRRFVLEPLAAIRPELILPGQIGSVTQLLGRLPSNRATRTVATEW
jgi:2-amino-4-hydroxy-6-hydroxymethyldihydropteridine diphosphokinase